MSDTKDRPLVLQSFSTSQAPEATMGAKSIDELAEI